MRVAKSGWMKEQRNTLTDRLRALKADQPQEACIRLDQRAALIQDRHSDREHRLQLGCKPRHGLLSANDAGGCGDGRRRVGAERVRSHHVCQTAEAVDGKSAYDHGRS